MKKPEKLQEPGWMPKPIICGLAVAAFFTGGLFAASENGNDSDPHTLLVSSARDLAPSQQSTESTKQPVAGFLLTPEQRSKIDTHVKDCLLKEYMEGYTGTDEYTGTDTYAQLVSRHYSANGKGMTEVSAVVRNGSESAVLVVGIRKMISYEGNWTVFGQNTYELPIEANLSAGDVLTTEGLNELLQSNSVTVGKITSHNQEGMAISATVVTVHEEGTFSVEKGKASDFLDISPSVVTDSNSAIADIERVSGTSLR
jgi:hypothetical protein